ncbi:MAG TPA: flagellar hook-associated protein FlgK, partial [Paracoccaceae bacterium]|nr:flagellar hook-associated protein FlgK [Paracoccaceae bacterium]
MTISATLSNALSGLNVAARGAETVSQNVANALTPGYGRREIEVSARVVGTAGQGAQVTGIRRLADMVAIGDRRLAEALLADRSLRATALKRIEDAIGTPEAGASISARIADLERTLIEATSRPEAEARLSSAVDAARGLASALNAASRAVQDVRMDADAAIAASVERINSGLARIAELNGQIRSAIGAGHDASALMDQRQVEIDRLAADLPLREIDRGMGQVALYTAGGAALLDGVLPARFDFVPAGVITPDMTLASGALSGLMLNGRPAPMGEGSLLAGGALAAAFALRDTVAPSIQADLDALARDLAERFETLVPDATRGPGDPGLFTDAGGAVLAANETGLAGRLRVAAAVDPVQGGAAWRLRDGLGAAAPGPAGETRLLSGLAA